jgi:hypothetical protein
MLVKVQTRHHELLTQIPTIFHPLIKFELSVTSNPGIVDAIWLTSISQ